MHKKAISFLAFFMHFNIPDLTQILSCGTKKDMMYLKSVATSKFSFWVRQSITLLKI